jgi:hypothetical protein
MEVTFLPITDTALSSSACRRAVMKTYAPSSTNLFAVAKPNPLLPPVMTASHTEVESKRHVSPPTRITKTIRSLFFDTPMFISFDFL